MKTRCDFQTFRNNRAKKVRFCCDIFARKMANIGFRAIKEKSCGEGSFFLFFFSSCTDGNLQNKFPTSTRPRRKKNYRPNENLLICCSDKTTILFLFYIFYFAIGPRFHPFATFFRRGSDSNIQFFVCRRPARSPFSLLNCAKYIFIN